MSSTTSKTSRRRRLAARLAAAGVLAAGTGFATATAAGAAPMCSGSNCSQYSGSIVVSSALSLFPSSGTFPQLLVAPGSGQQPIQPFVLDVDSTDSAGASLTVVLDSGSATALPFSDFATDSWTNATTPVKGQSPFAAGPVAIYSVSAPTGNIANHCSNNSTNATVPCTVSQSGGAINNVQQPLNSDILPIGFYITVPSGTPGSPAAGDSVAFDLALTGA